jgi:endonuclease/exonuclease/phosphatase family metal-dependent hydrolase
MYAETGKFSEQDFNLLLNGMSYKYVDFSVNKTNRKYGVAIYSRYPFIKKGKVFASPTGNSSIYADIDVNGAIIRVYNNHLQSIQLNLPKKIRNVVQGNEEMMGEIADISLRLKSAFIKRAQQVDTISRHVRTSPYPPIVCGDFNDTPISYTYKKLKGELKDAFCEAGQGMPSTHEGFFPSFRIDYILHDKQFNTNSYNVSEVHYSDHFPIIVRLNINNYPQ